MECRIEDSIREYANRTECLDGHTITKIQPKCDKKREDRESNDRLCVNSVKLNCVVEERVVVCVDIQNRNMWNRYVNRTLVNLSKSLETFFRMDFL